MRERRHTIVGKQGVAVAPSLPGSLYQPGITPRGAGRDAAWFARDLETKTVLTMGIPKERLRWLVQAVAQQQEGEIAYGQREVLAFIICQCGAGSAGFLGGPRPPDIPVKTLRAIASAVAQGLENFVDGKRWTVDVPTHTARTIETETVVLGRDKGKRKVVASWAPLGAAPGTPFSTRRLELTFLLAALDLVAALSESVARCSGCQKIFARDDLRQEYCTPRCSHNARMRAWRKAAQDRKHADKGNTRKRGISK